MRDKKYNILFISRNFPPLTGGMERLMYNSYKLLSEEFNCTLIGPHGASASLSSKNRSHECSFNILKFLPCSILKSYYAASKTQFDLVFAGSGINSLPAMLVSKARNIPYITYTHGLDITYKSFLYKKIFLPAIRSSELIITNSNNTSDVAKAHLIENNKIRVLNPGVHTPTTFKTEHDLTNKLDITNKKILLTAGRLVKRKGIAPFIMSCLPDIIRKHPDTLYLIAGEEPNNQTSRPVTNEILKAVESTGLQNNIIILGKLSDNELTSAYQYSDLFVFPVLNDPSDIEGFGMVAIEAASNGTPTIAFSSGGIPDAVQNHISGILIPPTDYISLTKTIIDYLEGETFNITKDTCRNFAEQFSWNNYKRKIISLCYEAIRKNK